MSRLILTEFGTPRDAVRLEESAEPIPGPAEVVVRMEAATLNSSDFLLIRGQYGVRPALPSPVGAEGVGRVVDAGPDADQTLVGKRVIILPSYEQGTWAQHVVTGAHNVIMVSDNTDPLQLAMIPINPATAYVLLSRFGELRTGDWVAQTGANSAMGRYVIALASARGIRTLNVVRRADAVDQVRDAGGDRVVVSDEKLAARISEALGEDELSLVLDPIGGPAVPELAAALKFGGTVVSYGGLSGQPPIVRPQDLIFKEVRLTGFWLINWLRNATREEIERTYRALADLVAAGQLTGPVEATYPLADYRRAFEHALTNKRDGKILFTFGDLD